jgi:hypothetical protein
MDPNRRSDPTFFTAVGLLCCYIQHLIMTVIETTARRKRAAVLRKTHGSLDDADGRAFDEAVAESRKMEADG